MPTVPALLICLHIGAGFAALGFAVVRSARPDAAWPVHGLRTAVALLAAASLPLASEAGWWVDMPGRKMVPIIATFALGLAALGTERQTGRLCALVLAAFFLTLGLASLRNGAPLAGLTAGKSILLGLLLGLLPWSGAGRLWIGVVIAVLAAGAGLGLVPTSAWP